MARNYRDDRRNDRDDRDSRSSRGNRDKGKSRGGKRGGKGSKFKSGDFLMMQVGICFLDETNYGNKVRTLFSQSNDAYTWCVRDQGEVTHWFGVKKGRELFLRALVEGRALITSAFYDQKDSDGQQGNARINIFDIATDEELEKAEQDAADEVWEDMEDDEEEDERPARKSKSKGKSKSKSKAKEEPVYDSEDDESEDDEETDDEEDLPY